ncbi:26S proteasome non-ATPase regulatory subunit 13 homolog B-like [Triticum dicoccoides]|uniref:26S proteasome non-ATPase regulatory subunit 13 homolog B-like n=1 Tax=Triticum dicoccoides TaxID=85692 RepID=UPI00188DE9E5|nr:26S proteasome non-ATPase regulatory subunit 13 homolog B-like [Triticum dicoccoides]
MAHTAADPTAEPRHFQAALSIPHWRDAMEQEFQALRKNDTWRLVPPVSGINVIDSKWVFKVKRHADGSIERYKAWLVAKGFKQRTSHWSAVKRILRYVSLTASYGLLLQSAPSYELPAFSDADWAGSPPVSTYAATATATTSGGDEVEATRGPPRGPGPVLPRRLLCSIWPPKEGDALIQLYTHFISDFERKINLLKFAHFAVVVSRQYSDNDAGISYLEGVILKLRDTKESRVEEPILYVKMQIASFLLEKGNPKECKKLVHEGKTTLDSMGDVDPSVHSTYYWLCSQYHKVCHDYSEFYKNALLYLAYTTAESHSEPFKQNLAFDLSLVALLGDNIYNIRELLAHPIV